MNSEPIYYESHMHTPLCKHATGDPEDYAAVAQRRGLKGIIVTCHSPTEGNAWNPGSRMGVEEFERYLALVERARRAWKGRVDVRPGLESDYAPGMEAWLERLHGTAELDYVLGSVHPHCREYRDRYFNGDMAGFQRTYFEHLAMAAETGLFDAISHPDLVKNVDPEQWRPERLTDAIHLTLDRIAASGVAMELNTSGLNKAIPEMNPGPAILEEMHVRNIPVVLGADAHVPERVADRFEDALDLLEGIGYTRVSVFLSRRRIDLEIDAVRGSLKNEE